MGLIALYRDLCSQLFAGKKTYQKMGFVLCNCITRDGMDMVIYPDEIRGQCMDTDQASAALITDLKQRGLLDETLVIWGGEFGRTNYCQGKLDKR